MASLMILFVGFEVFSGDENIRGLSWRIIILLLASFTFSLPIKDFKDMEGDKKDGVWTIPVIFGEEKGRIIVGAGIFISFMLSVFLLNELKLFWWALIFGIFSFWVINNKKIKPQSFFWWFLGIVFVYGLILVKVVFL
jgi:4-hydroxybenzoate polyprenyltransferase